MTVKANDVPLGIVLYNGPSMLHAKRPILVIATGLRGNSNNEKTGKAIQTWIIPQNIAPYYAKKLGEDFRVCGDCKHRHFNSCYVNILQAPNQVYRAWLEGKYVNYTPKMNKFFAGKTLRIGSYGDPTACPSNVWTDILPYVKDSMGYTHQWNKAKFQDFKHFCMASCDTLKEAKIAQSKGWRTFRIRLENDAVQDNEFMCPASKEAGHKTNCATCHNCHGGEHKDERMPTIIFHGCAWRKKHFVDGIKKVKAKKAYATAQCF